MTDEGDYIKSGMIKSQTEGSMQAKNEISANSATTNKAVTLILDILEQITSNDAPAQNELHTLLEEPIKYQPLLSPYSLHSAYKSPNSFSRNDSSVRSLENSLQYMKIDTKTTANSSVSKGPNVTSFETENTDPAMQYSNDGYSDLHSKSEMGTFHNNKLHDFEYTGRHKPDALSMTSHMSAVSQMSCADAPQTIKMGHSSLANLCIWTLDQIKTDDDCIAKNAQQHWKVDIDAVELETPRDSIHFTSQFQITNINTFKKKPKRHRLRFMRRNNTKRTSNSFNRRYQQAPHHGIVTDDDFPSSTARLQLFGSEYARHLSNCQLAPTPSSPKETPSLLCTTSIHSGRPGKISPRNVQYLEDAPLEIQNGAVLDLIISENEAPPPRGYYRISQTASGRLFQLPGDNTQNSKKGSFFHLNIKKEPVWDKAAQRPCVTAITIVYPDRNEFVPPGFCVARTVSLNPSGQSVEGPPANINCGSGTTTNDRVYICFRRSREGNPITGIVPLAPHAHEPVPLGYTVIERTPRNFAASLTSGTNTKPIFLSYRQRLASLETLRPLPLLMAVQERKHPERETKYVLNSYYCTGGNTVDADIGRFHIMDRTTHSLLSPSSVSNRMNLIEISRRKARNQQSDDLNHSIHHYKRSDVAVPDENDDVSSEISTASFSYHKDHSMPIGSLGGSGASNASFGASSCAGTERSTVSSGANANLSSLLMSKDGVEATYVMEDKLEAERRKRLRALNFIPMIETAVGTIEADSRREARVTIISPILTACYTRHGGAAHIAVEGLTSLLTGTDFFKDDVDLSDAGDNESSRRLTLLDLAIQSVCDVATTGCQESTFASCVAFVERAVSFSQGQLNMRTVGIVLRFYIFIFYFDACIPRKEITRCPAPSWRPVAMMEEDDFPMLYDMRIEDEKPLSYLPGGAPQAAALALKDLISFSIIRLGKTSISDLLYVKQSNSGHERCGTIAGTSEAMQDAYAPLMDSILSSLVNNAVDHVDRANFAQLALHQIHRSGGSELFWHEMVQECGRGLFGKDTTLRETGRDVFIMVFAMLQQLVKISSGKLKPSTNQSVGSFPKDIASKLLSLELLLHFLEFWSDEQEAVNGMNSTDRKSIPSVDTLAFVVRRTVTPCLLWNTQAGIENPQVFRRVISIISEMWGSPVYRKHCKLEIGKLVEHFALTILEMGPHIPSSKKKSHSTLFLQQIELMNEVRSWFSNDPNDVVELYLNYDADPTSQNSPMLLSSGAGGLLFQRLCAALCMIAEKCGELIADQIRQNQTVFLSQRGHSNSLFSELQPSKESAKKDAKAATFTRESSKLMRKTSTDAISEIVKSLALAATKASGKKYSSLLSSWMDSTSANNLENCREANDFNSNVADEDGDDEVIKYWRNAIAADQHEKGSRAVLSTQESILTAINIANTKCLKKAVEYLIACNVLTQSPRDIANFLQFQRSQFNAIDLGVYLSEGGISGIETDYWNSIRYQFVRASSFIGMTVEEGLRHFLTKLGFKLPGEAQRIDRMLSTFAQVYFEDNAGDNVKCPFQDHEVIYLLVFAVIMLNTDLHKVENIPRKGRKKMTKAEFMNNLRGAMQGETVSKEFMSRIYDSIESNPIVMEDESLGSVDDVRKQSINNMITNVRPLDSLLRGLAVHDFQFVKSTEYGGNASENGNETLSDLIRSCVSKSWHHWYGVVNTCMETAHLDPQGMESSVEILLYALCATICLGMPTERSAFLSQLVRLKAFEEHRHGRWVSAPTGNDKQASWIVELEHACSGTTERRLWAMEKIFKMVTSLQAALHGDVPNKIGMASAVTEIVDGSFLLQDPSRSYVRSGDLIKKSGRTGRQAEYRFYLFSDVLLYASKQNDSYYKIHEELPLHLMKIVDWFPPSFSGGKRGSSNMFEVHHPRKRFHVICTSSDERKSWVDDIRAAISKELDRKMKVEAARLSIYDAPSF